MSNVTVPMAFLPTPNELKLMSMALAARKKDNRAIGHDVQEVVDVEYKLHMLAGYLAQPASL